MHFLKEYSYGPYPTNTPRRKLVSLVAFFRSPVSCKIFNVITLTNLFRVSVHFKLLPLALIFGRSCNLKLDIHKAEDVM